MLKVQRYVQPAHFLKKDHPPPTEDISVILLLKKPQYKSLRILAELVLAVPN